MKKLLAPLLITLSLAACANAETGQYDRNYCRADSDCVPAQCCHPAEVVNKKFAPDCTATMCTMMCKGPLDCGAGTPVCKNNVCVIQPLR